MPIWDEEYELIERRIMAKIEDRDLALVVKEHFRNYLIKVGIAIIAIAGGGMLYLASNVAENVARDVASTTAAETSATETAKMLVNDADLRAKLGDSIFSEIVKLNGAVVAFDGVEKCPEGWTAYAAGEGRVIVGVGATKDDRGETRAIEPGESAGEFSHILEKEEMPMHDHQYDTAVYVETTNLINLYGEKVDPRARFGNWWVARKTEVEGDSLPHNNMPPFIALYFCKKDQPT